MTNQRHPRAHWHDNAQLGAISIQVEYLEELKEAQVHIQHHVHNAYPGMLMDLTQTLRKRVDQDYEQYVHVKQVVHSTSPGAGLLGGMWISPASNPKLRGLTYERTILLDREQAWADLLIGTHICCGEIDTHIGPMHLQIKGEIVTIVNGCRLIMPNIPMVMVPRRSRTF